MSRKKISQLESATNVTSNDLLQIVDIEDGDMAPSGTNKKVSANLLADELGKLMDVTATGSTTARSLSNRFADVVNVKDFGAVGDGVTDDTVAIQAAVTHCFGTGDDLYWPDFDFVSTASITNLHSVRHRGAGRIKRGGSVFYVDPRGTQSNTVYLSPTGSAANDGLSAAEPMASFQGAFDAVDNYGPMLDGIWNIVSDAGAHTISTGQQTFSTPSKNRVVIRGPAAGHPNVPTCIIDGGGNQPSYRHGLSASGYGVQVEFRDIKAQNFTEASGNTRIGFVGENNADVYWNNCHTFACTWTGIYAFSIPRTRIKGGILDGNGNAGAACVITNETECTLGYGASSTADGTVLKNAGIGVYWSRGSQGHIDYCKIEDNSYGIQIGESSRVDTVANNLKRNAIGIRCFSGGVFGEGGAPNVMNGGTADANTTAFAFSAYSGNSDELLTSQSAHRVAYDRTTRTASGAVSDTFPVVETIPAYRMQGVGKSCRVAVFGIYTVSAGSTLTVNFGGMALTLSVPAAATNEAFYLEAELLEVAGGYRAFGRLGDNLTAARTGTATAGFSNNVAQDVSVGYNLTGPGDSLSIYRTDVFVTG